jgi:hypothetical protein
MNLHSGKKPHKCDVCHSEFTQASTLKMQMVSLHTAEKAV